MNKLNKNKVIDTAKLVKTARDASLRSAEIPSGRNPHRGPEAACSRACARTACGLFLACNSWMRPLWSLPSPVSVRSAVTRPQVQPEVTPPVLCTKQKAHTCTHTHRHVHRHTCIHICRHVHRHTHACAQTCTRACG